MFFAIVIDHLIVVIDACKTDPVELWVELKWRFQLGALERQLALKNRLIHIQMKEGQTVEEYIYDIQVLINELGKTNYQIDQQRLINVVLYGLSRPKWDNFIENFGLQMRRHPNIQLSKLIEEL